MTNGQDSSSDDPFQVVLIDIQKASQAEIYCVKKSLTEELKYVAISYRWGELQESIIDTDVGYSASITSFNIHDFYKLCAAMAYQPDFQSIPYVWVDAICVNQSNRDERKATIHHMNDIYEHATWILAVPDLHAAHLKAMHSDVMSSLERQQVYLYHLLHRHTDTLHKLDDDFLDKIGVPHDSNLRELLKNYTDSFTDSFLTPVAMNSFYNHVRAIEHLYNSNKSRTADFLSTIIGRKLQTRLDIEPLHQCDEEDCPLEYCHHLAKVPSFKRQSEGWVVPIIERRMEIRQAMHFLTDLVMDWSSRVWVISEFHISEKNNNLKFWFTQLGASSAFRFFTFGMDDPRFIRIQNTKISGGHRYHLSDPVYFTFYQRLVKQLNRQSFLEMMLKSKASKHEDRFYAIFPFFPQYKPLLQKEELDNMNSILDVKLKLYKVMTNEHKLLLLYLSSNGNMTSVLPTFATSAIHWPKKDDYNHVDLTSALPAFATSGFDWPEKDDHKHVDLTTPIDITLLYQDKVGHYLRVKPTKYAMTRDELCRNAVAKKTLNRLLHPKTLRQDGRDTRMDVLRLYDTMPTPIVFIGSFNENTWIVSKDYYSQRDEIAYDATADFTGFHVY